MQNNEKEKGSAEAILIKRETIQNKYKLSKNCVIA